MAMESYLSIAQLILTVENKTKYLKLRSNVILAGFGEAIVFVQNDGPDIHLSKPLVVLESVRQGNRKLIEVPHNGLGETERRAKEEAQR